MAALAGAGRRDAIIGHKVSATKDEIVTVTASTNPNSVNRRPAADGRKEAEEREVLAHFVYGLKLSAKCLDRAYERYFSSRRGRADLARKSVH